MTEEEIKNQEKQCEALGIKSAIQLIKDKVVDTKDQSKMLKVNLPSRIGGFTSGNGEGIWATALTDKDVAIYEEAEQQKTFEVVLLNASIRYPFPWGSIITVKNTRKNSRPVLDKNWVSEVIDKASNGDMSLETMLS